MKRMGSTGTLAGIDIPAGTVTTESCNSWRAKIVLRGDIDGAFAPRVYSELDRHLRAGRRVLRLDVRGVEFVDTTALAILLESHWRCVRLGGTLMLSRVRDPVQRLLTLTGLDLVLLIDRADYVGAGGGVTRSPRARISGVTL